jgi:gamma-glutamyltranspeptidase/glutathione hydrolase
VLSVVLGVTEYGLNGREAVNTPRLHHQWLPDRAAIEEGGAGDEVLAALRGKGHDIRVGGRQGDAHSIWIAPDGVAYGVNDTRTPDSKASVPQQLTLPVTGR